MARSTSEWIGKTDDTPIPPRVRIRIFDGALGRCYLCGRKISAGEYWQADHVTALCNGGSNRESNILPACRNCCYTKSAEDVAEKSKVADTRKSFLLPKQGKMAGSRGTRFKKLMNGQVIERKP